MRFTPIAYIIAFTAAVALAVGMYNIRDSIARHATSDIFINRLISDSSLLMGQLPRRNSAASRFQRRFRHIHATKSCDPTARNPIFFGCFRGNSPYRHTVSSLLNAGAIIHHDLTAVHYWNNGNPLTADNINSDGRAATIMWVSDSSDPAYKVSCPVYKPGFCAAATSQTHSKIHIPLDARPTTDSDHHIFIFDLVNAEEVDMWGGFGDGTGGPTALINGVTTAVACQVGTYTPGQLTCSWGGIFPLSGNSLPLVPGNSGIAGDVAYGMAAITAGDILSGRIHHALGIVGPCLDDDGQYPATPGRGTDSKCVGNAAYGGNGAEPTLRYGDMLHLKSSVNLNAMPYSKSTRYCHVVLRALQEYGAYADDNSNGYGLHLIVLDQDSPGWNTIMASMISGGDATGDAARASWNSCFNRINVMDLETITLNQGNKTIEGGNASLPPTTLY